MFEKVGFLEPTLIVRAERTYDFSITYFMENIISSYHMSEIWLHASKCFFQENPE